MKRINIQRGLEESSLDEGGKRFRKKLERAIDANVMSGAGAAKKLLRDGIEPLEKAITKMIEQPRRGTRPSAVKWCVMIGPPAAAFMTLKVVLDGLRLRRPVRKLANDIANLILDELRWRKFRQEAPHLFRYRLDGFNTSSYRHKAGSLTATMRWAKINTEGLDKRMTPSEKVLVGIKLIDLLMIATQLVVRKKYFQVGRRRIVDYLEPTEETMSWMKKRNQFLEFLSPVNFPMVVMPQPWAPGKRGGYMFAQANKYPLIRKPHPEFRINIDSVVAPMPEVYKALNAVQATPFKINPHIWRMVQEINASGKALAGLPAAEPLEFPVKPHDIDTDEKSRKRYRDLKHDTHEEEHLRQVKANELQKTLGTARRMKGFKEFWFPTNLDFRGRLYPMSDYMSLQGMDVSRALLLFARGKPLGEDGAYWLAVAGANHCGTDPRTEEKIDKLSLDERAEWTVKNSDEIARMAQQPWDNPWWQLAESPLQFYAFCKEWVNYLDKGDDLVSGFPVTMDGTCNGVQHFSAMLQDEKAAKAVNMLDLARPQDLYQVVADTVIDLLVESEDHFAKVWLHSELVTRNLCKRPTMTFGYGAQRYGFTMQLHEYLTTEGLGHRVGKNRAEIKAACSYLASVIWRALQQTVKAAYDAMIWMRQMAQAICKTSKTQPIRWTAPTGFPVFQEYYKSESRRVATILAGKIIRPRIYTETDKSHAYKHQNAISPNFVHSLDAAALCKTVCLAVDRGVTSFGMIHDSYATVPADVGTLADCTREMFVEMYEKRNVIATFYQELLEQYKGDNHLPTPPKPGRLDVRQVINATFFFS